MVWRSEDDEEDDEVKTQQILPVFAITKAWAITHNKNIKIDPIFMLVEGTKEGTVASQQILNKSKLKQKFLTAFLYFSSI